jgi:hypothetical protein
MQTIGSHGDSSQIRNVQARMLIFLTMCEVIFTFGPARGTLLAIFGAKNRRNFLADTHLTRRRPLANMITSSGGGGPTTEEGMH